MKVLLRRNVAKLGQIGEVVDVRDGYARNYLIPNRLAMVPSRGNLKVIGKEKQEYLAELARLKAELETQARLLEGREFTITARANEEGHLYGSVGPAQIAAAIGNKGVLVDAENIELDEPLRRLDKYEVTVRLAPEVKATVQVWIVPPRDQQAADGEAVPAGDEGESPSGPGEAP